MKHTSIELTRSLKMGWIMGLEDFKRIGLGTRMGRLWPTLSLAIRVLFIGTVFGLVFQAEQDEYLPWLTSGIITWTLISSTIASSAKAFVASKGLMLAIPIPKAAFIVRILILDVLVFAQNLAVMAGVLVVFKIQITERLLLLIPGLVILATFLIGLGMILAPMASKYRDMGPLVTAVINVMFFILPIVWQPERIHNAVANLILGLNPLYHYVQIIRLPLINQWPTPVNYLLASIGAVVFLLIGTLVLKKTKDKVVYWS